jgi:uncharacterized membrane protein YkoI
MRHARGWLGLTVLALLPAGLAARADDVKEGKIPLDKVPRAVLDAAKAKFKGAELIGAQTEKEDGKLIYEIVLKHQGHSIDASFSPDGKLLSYEKTLEARELPKGVADTLRAKYGACTVKRAEELNENDKISYEVLLVTADKKQFEVVLDETGKVLKEGKKEAIKSEKKEDK